MSLRRYTDGKETTEEQMGKASAGEASPPGQGSQAGDLDPGPEVWGHPRGVYSLPWGEMVLQNSEERSGGTGIPGGTLPR
jgi:hypothetical protein